ncbi:MAG: HAMP domain-containing histidine kinase, partial [Patulibacter sp.]|nr:HAMP domain-containing histidine kinase [Patulibacter sp.]
MSGAIRETGDEPHALRTRLTLLVVGPLAIGLVALLIVANLGLRAGVDRDADARARSAAVAAVAAVRVSDAGRIDASLLRVDPDLAGRVWVFSGDEALVRGPGDETVQQAASAAARGHRGVHDVPGRVRLYTLPLNAPDSTAVGAVVAAQPVAERGLVVNLVLVASIGLGLMLIAGVAAVVWRAVGRALRPVTELTRAATTWDERDLDAGLSVASRADEIGALTRALEDLLDRLAASLRQSRRLSAELSHELRTPLARIVAELDLLRARERTPNEREQALEVIGRAAGEMERIVGSLMAAARSEAGGDPAHPTHPGRSELGDVLDRIESAWSTPLELRGVRLSVERPREDVTLGASGDLIERIVGPILENAARHAQSRVDVATTREPR